jgi:hypothetical protein
MAFTPLEFDEYHRTPLNKNMIAYKTNAYGDKGSGSELIFTQASLF